jgi:hypothetical protein
VANYLLWVAEIVSEFNKHLKFVPLSESHVIQLISNLVDKVKGRNKLIGIANASTHEKAAYPDVYNY